MRVNETGFISLNPRVQVTFLSVLFSIRVGCL